MSKCIKVVAGAARTATKVCSKPKITARLKSLCAGARLLLTLLRKKE